MTQNLNVQVSHFYLNHYFVFFRNLKSFWETFDIMMTCRVSFVPSHQRESSSVKQKSVWRKKQQSNWRCDRWSLTWFVPVIPEQNPAELIPVSSAVLSPRRSETQSLTSAEDTHLTHTWHTPDPLTLTAVVLLWFCCGSTVPSCVTVWWTHSSPWCWSAPCSDEVSARPRSAPGRGLWWRPARCSGCLWGDEQKAARVRFWSGEQGLKNGAHKTSEEENEWLENGGAVGEMEGEGEDTAAVLSLIWY